MSISEMCLRYDRITLTQHKSFGKGKNYVVGMTGLLAATTEV